MDSSSVNESSIGVGIIECSDPSGGMHAGPTYEPTNWTDSL